MILVVGSTGVLGGMITRQLLAEGKGVRVLLRPDSPAAEMARQGLATDPQTLVDAGASVALGDLRDRGSLDAACEGVDTVITTANAALRSGDFAAVDLKGGLSLIDAAREAGAGHFIYTSALGADPDGPDPLSSAKGHCEAQLRAGDMSYTILAPGIFIEVWAGAVIGTPLRARQPITLVGQGTVKHAFVSMSDVAAYAVMAVDSAAARNDAISIAADKAYSWNDVVATVEQIVGHELAVDYVALGEPVPMLPEFMGAMLSGMEMAGSFINMDATSEKYGIAPTPMKTALQRMFGG